MNGQKEIRIRGSEFITDIWRLETYSPGTLLWQPPKRTIGSVKPQYRQLTLRVPSRLNAVILDMTKLVLSGHESLCDAGSVSFGVDLCSYAQVTIVDEPCIHIAPDCERPLVVQHVALLMDRLVAFSKCGLGVLIKAWGHHYEHVGLGSTAGIMDAVALALNTAFGDPIDDRWLRKILAFNYMEEHPSQTMLVPGQSTGASGAIARYGGACLVSSGAELVYRRNVPAALEIVIGIPLLADGVQGMSGEGVVESDVEIPSIDIIRHYERFNAARVCYWVLMELLPALETDDYRKVGDVIWDILLTGSKGTPTIIAHGTTRPLEILLDLRRAGVEVAFMSSVGPAIVTITSQKSRACEVLRNHGCGIIETRANNAGMEMVSYEAWSR